MIGKNKEKDEKIKKRIQNEIEIHSTLSHENIVSLYGHFEDLDNYYLLMELCEGGELYSSVKEKGKYSYIVGSSSQHLYNRLNEDEVRNYGLQFAKGLKYLHDNRVMHRDLKLSNLLLTEQNQLVTYSFEYFFSKK